MPSNYVERLVGEDLVEFHQQVVLGIKESDDCLSTSLHDFDYPRDVQDESQRLIIGENKKNLFYTKNIARSHGIEILLPCLEQR